MRCLPLLSFKSRAPNYFSIIYLLTNYSQEAIGVCLADGGKALYGGSKSGLAWVSVGGSDLPPWTVSEAHGERCHRGMKPRGSPLAWLCESHDNM